MAKWMAFVAAGIAALTGVVVSVFCFVNNRKKRKSICFGRQ